MYESLMKSEWWDQYAENQRRDTEEMLERSHQYQVEEQSLLPKEVDK